jgi:predicted MFS family arabinose efflux permease
MTVLEPEATEIRLGPLHGAGALVAASCPFAIAGFGILELPVRWAHDSGVSSSVTGIVLATFGFAYGCAQIPSGLLADRLGPVRTLRIAVVGCVLGWPLTLPHAWPIIAAGRVVFGFSIGLTFSAGLMLLRRRVHPTRLKTALAVFSTSWAVGMVCAAVFARSMLAAGLFLAVAAVVSWAALGHSGRTPREEEEVTASRLSLWPIRASWTVGAKVMLIVIPAGLLGQISLVTWGPRAASGEASISVVAVGLTVAAGIAAGSFIGSAIADVTWGFAAVALSPVLTGVILCVFAFAGGSEWLRLLTIGGATASSLINFSPGMARIFRETPLALQAGTTSLINQAGWLISALGPALLGIAATGSRPPRAAWCVVAGITAAAGGVAYAIDRTGGAVTGPRFMARLRQENQTR